MSSPFLPLSGSPRKKAEPMTVSTSDISMALTRIQIKLLVDAKILRSYANEMGDGKVLRLDLSDSQGRISAVAFGATASRLNEALFIGKTYNFKLPVIQKIYKKNGEDTRGLELRLTDYTSITEELAAPLERTLKFFQDLEECAGTTAIAVTIVSIRDEPFYFACSHCKKKNAEEAIACIACGKSPLSWRLLLNMTVCDNARQHRHVTIFEEQARVLIGKLPEGADVFEAVEQRCPELIGTEVILVCRSKLSSQEQVSTHSSVQVVDVELPNAPPASPPLVIPAQSVSPVASSSSSSSSATSTSTSTTTSTQPLAFVLNGFEIASSFAAKRLKLEMEQQVDIKTEPDVEVQQQVARKPSAVRNKK